MKWFDNMSVHITANHGTAVISNKVRPWNGQAKKHVLLDCPDIVKKIQFCNEWSRPCRYVDQPLPNHPTRQGDVIFGLFSICLTFVRSMPGYYVEDLQIN